MQTKTRYIPKDLTETVSKPELNGAIVHHSKDLTRGMVWMQCFSGKGSKPVHNWLVKPERFEKVVAEFFASVESGMKAKAERRAAIKTRQTETLAGIKVGTVLVNTWGWEQTNVDFYEVLAVLPKSLKVAPIAKTYREEMFMAGHAMPRPGVIIGVAQTVRPTKFRKWNGQPVYESHYA
jgi:hypothetical protein